ncbi:MAG: class I SAM-dependent methyltransferase [Chloroflexi bacterium]|nr:class I SAM-dependent methyltransferase [Chloroflexota bacterium]MCC6894986.1 class I SAM-dependent methyltransferase [Anaerolineae bacterium]
MNTETITRLNAINRDFYAAVADDFDQTRGTAWPGWQRLLPYLTTPLSVLDVGCGNGRFALFLHDNLHPSPNAGITYTGIDSSPALLAHAHDALIGKAGLHVTLEQRDIIENPPDTGEYDLVVLLGVLHHIPGYEQRQTFMRQLARRVKSGGLLVFAAWRFYEYERFRERIVPWPEDMHIEANDYLLDWRRGAVSLRYCHYTDDAEHDALVTATGLTEIVTYRADGQGGASNRYSLLRYS